MSTDRRELEPWEKAECAALKAAVDAYRAENPIRGRKMSQTDLAEILGMPQGNLNGHLNGRRPIRVDLAVRIAEKLNIPVSSYSPRLAEEIKRLSAFAPDYDAIADEVEAEIGPSLGAMDGPALVAKGRRDDERRADAFQSELVSALSIILMAAASRKITPKQAEPIFDLRNRIAHGHIDTESVTKISCAEVPASMRGLIDAALKTAESGGNPDDLLSMIKHGNDKLRHKEDGEHEKPSKARAKSR